MGLEDLPSLDAKPEKKPSKKWDKKESDRRSAEEIAERNKMLKGMTKSQKLKMLDDKLLDSYIIAMDDGDLKPLELGAVVTYLKNNKEVAEKKEESEADIIEDLVEKQ